MKQAALRLKQSLQNDIIHLIKSEWIDPNIERSLNDQKLVEALILGFSNQIRSGHYQLAVPEAQSAQWKSFIAEKLIELEIFKSNDLKLKLINKDGGFQLSFGDDEFKSLFEEFPHEDLAQMLFGND